MIKITKDQALDIALRDMSNKFKEQISVSESEEFDRDRIYGFDFLQKRWQDKSVWFVTYPEIPGAICSSNCMVIDRETGEVLAKFSLNDEG